MFYKLLNAYTQHFPFPHRGLKYFLKVAKWFGLSNKFYSKKLRGNFYLRVNPSEHIQQQLFWYGYYEKELGDLIKTLLAPGDVFLDIGANVGYFSLLAASYEPTIRVFSFEPVSSVYQKLEENISINDAKNIRTIKAAAGRKNGDGEIYISGPDNTGMSSFEKPGNFSGQTEKVSVIAIDEWIKSSGLSMLSLVKLDIEGYELAALEGMKETLEYFKPLIIAEINPEILLSFGLAPADIFRYMSDSNFTGFLILKNSKLKLLSDYQTGTTENVLFIHNDKIELYNHLLINN